ncbi:sigma-70 family RNA polymerase sigma factor [Lacrimispora sp. 38-1]|uniref:sigma-70 family RNA polymerase sigma factor n=1 Tax=Lacrimispora sp. 38-1 TaxID=3125778 RepID=UPI003CEC811D
MNAEKKVLLIEGTEVEVTQEVYEAYWEGYNELENIKRSDLRHQVMRYDADDTEEGLGVEKYPSKEKWVEDLVEKNILEELLRFAINELSDDEKQLIRSFYYEEKSFRQLAVEYGVDHKTVSLKHKKIIEKLKQKFEE